MTLLAITLDPPVRRVLFTIVQTCFVFFIVVSFLLVANYLMRQVRLGRLIPSGREPLPLNMPKMAGWFFIISVFVLILLEPSLYMLLVLMGAAGVLIENQRSAPIQFGFDRLNHVRTFTFALLAFGAVMLIETPLAEFSDFALNAMHIAHPEQQTVVMFRQYDSLSAITGFLIQAVLIAPVMEELFFRGIVLSFFKTYMSSWGAIILSAAVFAGVHLNLGAFLPLWFLGFALGLAYEHTGSLLVPIGMHMVFNLATGLSLQLVKATTS